MQVQYSTPSRLARLLDDTAKRIQDTYICNDQLMMSSHPEHEVAQSFRTATDLRQHFLLQASLQVTGLPRYGVTRKIDRFGVRLVRQSVRESGSVSQEMQWDHRKVSQRTFEFPCQSWEVPLGSSATDLALKPEPDDV